MEIQLRIYHPGSADSQLVVCQSDGSRLFSKDGFSVNLDDLELDIGGHTEDRIKLHCKSTGTLLIAEDRGLLDLLAESSPHSALAEQASQANQRLRRHAFSTKRYWVTVLVLLLLIPLAIYLSVDFAAACLADKIDPKIETQLGRMLSKKMENDSTAVYRADSKESRRVEAIGQKLVACLKNNPYKFEFHIKNDEDINACTYPGGIIFLNSGLVAKADDDELAGVIGHEIGHAVHRDTLRGLAHNAGAITCIELLANTGFNDIDQVAGALSVAQHLESLQFSRSQESAADLIGLQLATEANYKGDGLLRFFKIMEANPSTADMKYLSMLSTHPLNQERIAAVKAWLKSKRLDTGK